MATRRSKGPKASISRADRNDSDRKHGDPSAPDLGLPQLVRAASLDREARVFLRFFNVFSRRPAGEYSTSELRRAWRLLALALGRREPVARVCDQEIEGPAGPIATRIYFPDGPARNLPGLVWCHGGGFVVGEVDSADAMCRSIAAAAGAIVVSVRYRLAPEHDLYAGREDFLAALDWVSKNGDAIGIDTSRLAIGGDSAGGNIAAAVAQECVRRGRAAIKLQVLAYPATNLKNDFPSKAENAHGYFLTADTMDWMKGVFAASIDLEDQWISPGLAADLRGCPPAMIITAGFDPVRDDGLGYAARLRAAGVPVELLHYPGQFHGFLNFDSILGAARDALARIAGGLAQTLHGTPVDRTIEIHDETPLPGRAIRNTVSEIGSAGLMVWESLEQWNDTLMRLLSPKVAAVQGLVLLPLFAPGAAIRRIFSAQCNPPIARHTWPRQPAS